MPGTAGCWARIARNYSSKTGQALFYLHPGCPKLSRKGGLAEPCSKWRRASVVVSVPPCPFQVLVGGRGGRFRGLEGKEMWTPCCLDSQKTPVSCGGKKEGVCSRVYLMGSGEKVRFLSICVSSFFFVVVHIPYLLRGCGDGYVRLWWEVILWRCFE